MDRLIRTTHFIYFDRLIRTEGVIVAANIGIHIAIAFTGELSNCSEFHIL